MTDTNPRRESPGEDDLDTRVDLTHVAPGAPAQVPRTSRPATPQSRSGPGPQGRGILARLLRKEPRDRRALLQYQVLEKIGEGGMGEVFRARDMTLDREVAIKVLPAEFAADPERIVRFEREARSWTATRSSPRSAP